MRHLFSINDLSSAEIERIFAITQDLKSKFEQGVREPLLPGRVMALLFEKPSLRTRVSFEAGMSHLGGSSLFLGEDVGWGSRESIADFGRVLSQFVDVIVVRAKAHQKILDLAEHSTCPVINGLTDYCHPCQALADLYTVREHFAAMKGLKVAYVGDANNVARSLGEICGKLGVKFACAAPNGYQFSDEEVKQLRQESSGINLQLTDDPKAAVKDAQAVYTDVWTSMGQEAEREVRRKVFAAYQVNESLMKAAPKDALFMHCLPANRGEEVTDGVMDSQNSVVVQQAGNRMHVQKGVLAWLLGSKA
ncbi:MAG: ornithine carbamoyltransferase [Planctomycetaceae bacterium]|nr:ornithine carbamoyltransferase [Planctomycetaceae bacterium]